MDRVQPARGRVRGDRGGLLGQHVPVEHHQRDPGTDRVAAPEHRAEGELERQVGPDQAEQGAHRVEVGQQRLPAPAVQHRRRPRVHRVLVEAVPGELLGQLRVVRVGVVPHLPQRRVQTADHRVADGDPVAGGGDRGVARQRLVQPLQGPVQPFQTGLPQLVQPAAQVGDRVRGLVGERRDQLQQAQRHQSAQERVGLAAVAGQGLEPAPQVVEGAARGGQLHHPAQGRGEREAVHVFDRTPAQEQQHVIGDRGAGVDPDPAPPDELRAFAHGTRDLVQRPDADLGRGRRDGLPPVLRPGPPDDVLGLAPRGQTAAGEGGVRAGLRRGAGQVLGQPQHGLALRRVSGAEPLAQGQEQVRVGVHQTQLEGGQLGRRAQRLVARGPVLVELLRQCRQQPVAFGQPRRPLLDRSDQVGGHVDQARGVDPATAVHRPAHRDQPGLELAVAGGADRRVQQVRQFAGRVRDHGAQRHQVRRGAPALRAPQPFECGDRAAGQAHHHGRAELVVHRVGAGLPQSLHHSPASGSTGTIIRPPGPVLASRIWKTGVWRCSVSPRAARTPSAW